MKQVYTITNTVWLYPGDKAAWHFLTIPTEIASEIDFVFGDSKRGWGSLPVTVTIGSTSWTTSIFPDKKTQSYLLPLKADVRKRERIEVGTEVEFKIEINS